MNEPRWMMMTNPEKMVWSTIVAQKMLAHSSATEAIAAADELTEKVGNELRRTE